MQLQNRPNVSQSETAPHVCQVATKTESSMPALLAALDAAETAGDQARAEQLIGKIYETMDLIARGAD